MVVVHAVKYQTFISSFSLTTITITTDGNKRDEFYIGRDQGNVLLAKQLDYETQNFYNLTISVSDMQHTVHTQVCQLLMVACFIYL